MTIAIFMIRVHIHQIMEELSQIFSRMQQSICINSCRTKYTKDPYLYLNQLLKMTHQWKRQITLTFPIKTIDNNIWIYMQTTRKCLNLFKTSQMLGSLLSQKLKYSNIWMELKNRKWHTRKRIRSQRLNLMLLNIDQDICL